MHPFQERRKWRKILYSKTVLVLLVVVLALVARGAWNIHQKSLIAKTERDRAAQNLAELELRTKDLEGSITTLKSAFGEEGELRQKFSVAGKGEDLVVVVDETDQNGKNTGATGDRGFLSWFR